MCTASRRVKNVKNAEYWRKRMELLMEAEMMEAEEFEKEVFRAYSEAIRSMQQDIELWYVRFAKNNQVSLAEARKMLRKRELEELRWTLEEYIRHGQENGISADWTKQLENASARVHISRLESLQIQCYEHVHEVTGSLSKGLQALLAGIYTDGFYRTIFEYQKAESESDPFARLNADRVDRILKNPWSRDGTEFSERIWRERDKLVRELHTGLTQSMIRGDPLEKMIKHVMERFDVSRANASRIVRTESAEFAVLSQRDALRALGVKEYEVCGTLDGKTCTICGEMDKKVFPMSLFKTGMTAPVFHPNCRCCISPHVKEEIPGKRAARGPDGKTYYVPSDMNYSEWKKKYVDNADDAHDINLVPLPITEKSVKNIRKFHCETLSPVLQSKLQDAHKDLLLAVADKPLGTEAGATFTLTMTQMNKVFGEAGVAKLHIPKENIPYIAAHTHPTGGTFTHNDLRLFAKDRNMKVLTAVGNNGAVYAVEKNDVFSLEKFNSYRVSMLKQHPDYLKSPEKYAEYIQEFLKGVETCGIRYYAIEP